MLQVIGAGLPRTGTKSLCKALCILGYNAVHCEPERLPLFPDANTDWRCCDDIDAITDAPAARHWQELAVAYPDAKIVLAVRNEDEWWRSIQRHVNTIRSEGSQEDVQHADAVHSLLFGCSKPSEYWYRRRFREHTEMVQRGTLDRLTLAFDVCDGWEPLCGFLGKQLPDVPFPWLNKAGELASESHVESQPAEV